MEDSRTLYAGLMLERIYQPFVGTATISSAEIVLSAGAVVPLAGTRGESVERLARTDVALIIPVLRPSLWTRAWVFWLESHRFAPAMAFAWRKTFVDTASAYGWPIGRRRIPSWVLHRYLPKAEFGRGRLRVPPMSSTSSDWTAPPGLARYLTAQFGVERAVAGTPSGSEVRRQVSSDWMADGGDDDVIVDLRAHRQGRGPARVVREADALTAALFGGSDEP